MSTYLNIQFQKKTAEGKWENIGSPVYCQSMLRELLSPRSLYDYDTTSKGFPEDFEVNRDGTWDATYYSYDEIQKFVEQSRENFTKSINERGDKNTYEIFKGIVKDKEYEEITIDKYDAETDDSLIEYEVLNNLASTMRMFWSSFAENVNTDIRIVVWYD